MFLTTAQNIAQRILDRAIWNDEKCSWNVVVPTSFVGKNRDTKYELAEGSVYQGSAGIALFLAELYDISLCETLRHTIDGALLHAFEWAKTAPKSFSFHSGSIGVSYVLWRWARISGDEKALAKSKTLLTSIYGHESEDTGLDIIAGAAGAIPALLAMANDFGDEEIVKCAIRLGQNLLNRIRIEPNGWAINTMPHTSTRCLCGYAHGAAGFVHAFAELYAATQNEAYLYVSEQICRYEQSFFAPDKSGIKGYPDFRYSEWHDIFYDGGKEALREAFETGELHFHTPSNMCAWCHGTSGVALSRLRLYEITQNTSYADQALEAVKSTIETFPHQYNFSLCHGISGNADVLLSAAKTLKMPTLCDIATEYLQRGNELYEDTQTPWAIGIVATEQYDPSLMIGEAGIGLFALRLSNPATPSVLAVQPQEMVQKHFNQEPAISLSDLKKRNAHTFFENTFSILEKLGQKWAQNEGDFPKTLNEAENLLAQKIAFLSSDCQPHVGEVFQLEKQQIALQRAQTDFVAPLIQQMLQAPFDEIAAFATFQLDPSRAQRVSTSWNWEAWLEQDEVSPTDSLQNYLIHAPNSQVTCRPISAFTALVMQQLETPHTLQSLTESLLPYIEAPFDALLPKVRAQLSAFYEMGMTLTQPALSITENVMEA